MLIFTQLTPPLKTEADADLTLWVSLTMILMQMQNDSETNYQSKPKCKSEEGTDIRRALV